MMEVSTTAMESVTQLRIQISRLEERLAASDKALLLAGNALLDWQKSSSEIITRVAILEKHSNSDEGGKLALREIVAWFLAAAGLYFSLKR